MRGKPPSFSTVGSEVTGHATSSTEVHVATVWSVTVSYAMTFSVPSGSMMQRFALATMSSPPAPAPAAASGGQRPYASLQTAIRCAGAPCSP